MLKPAILLQAYELMATARAMSDLYDTNRAVCRYVHSTSRGHEAIQLATGMQLQACDWMSPYYRDDSLLLATGFTSYELMLQLLAKKDDPFSGGRSYYCHPSSKAPDKPSIIHQSSATGMQTIPTTGLAQGIQFLEKTFPEKLGRTSEGYLPIALCSFGDGSATE